MSRDGFPWRSATFALFAGILASVLIGAGIAIVEGVRVSAPSTCVSEHLSPSRALPWLLVAAAPFAAYALVRNRASRRPQAAIAVGAGPYRASMAEPTSRIHAPRSHLYVRVAVALIALAIGAAQSRGWSAPFSLPASCQPKMKRIALVPLGKIEPTVVGDLAKHFERCYGLPITVSAPIEPPPSARDAKRDQSIAEELLKALPACSTNDASCEPQVTIGITDDDLFIKGVPDWNWAFASRDPDRNTAVISTFRMASYDGQGNRAAKMVARNIAIEYCGLAGKSDPQSILYGELTALKGLDDMDESVW